ncbi:L,D-transpeptidase family protein [Enterococcus sp.]|uniref:L,D-transpeptidase family protein n=1 Tax=Enterococcus sp. TaxID=35783 RepID=UPI0028B154EA|nr:L,D-transpeptidase [Enterococcus sp.]
MKKVKRRLLNGALAFLLLATPVLGTGIEVFAAATNTVATTESTTNDSNQSTNQENSASNNEDNNTTGDTSTSASSSDTDTQESSKTPSSEESIDEGSSDATGKEAKTETGPSSSTSKESRTVTASSEDTTATIAVQEVQGYATQYVKLKTIAISDTENVPTSSLFYRLTEGTLSENGSNQGFAGQVFKAVKQYKDSTANQAYLLLQNDQGQGGIVESGAVSIASGTLKTENKYVTIQKNNYPLWQSVFLDKQLTTTANYNQKTYLVKESFYKNSNNATYYALYDNKQTFIGWINGAGTNIAANAGGVWQKENSYATITSSNYTLWQNFNWTAQKGTTAAINGQTVKVTGKYSHFNGSTYYSLYDKNNKWLGYINATGVKLSSNAQGVYQNYGKYVTLTKQNYTIWGNFSWTSKKNNTTALAGKTYLAKGKYSHANGALYLSLYDKSGKWIGYVNASAATVATNQGGIWQSEKLSVQVKNSNYTLWQDLNFSKQKANSGSYLNQTIKVTGKYQHYNGSTYYSLYDKNNKWLGYINATGVKSAHTIYSQSTISRYVIVNNSSGNFFDQADPNSTKLGAKSTYKGYMAQATKLAKTSDGNYLYLVSPAGKIGWIKESQTYSVNSNFWMYTTGGKYPSLDVKNLNIQVSISKQRVYIKSGDKVIYTMLCSTGAVGTPTPLGSFRIQAEKGLAFSGAAYYRSFKDHGIYLFHTIPTSIAWSTNTFSAVEGRKLGTRASHGCIRLAVPDAKWFYYNMPYNTPVKIVN